MTVTKLNKLLGESLGTNPYGESIFGWSWSEDLMWPASATGKYVETKTPGGIIMLQREYERRRMTDKFIQQWIVTKWFGPEHFADWERNFPGAGFPSRGYRVHTDWALPPNVLPTLQETESLIRVIREQTSMTHKERLADMEAEADRVDNEKQRVMEDEIRDLFPAFANPTPGKRGGEISFGGLGESPQTKKQEKANA